jgi:hypothetical protein
MALVWDAEKMKYVWDTGPYGTKGPSGAMEQAQAQLAGTIVPQLGAPTQYGLGARQAFGAGWQDRPFLSQAIGQAYNPTYGRYLTEYGGLGGGQGVDANSFAQYVANQAGQAGFTSPQGWKTPDAWGDIINVARSLSPTYTPGTGTGPSTAPTTAMTNKWSDILADPTQAGALASMALYDPQAGSIYGQLRQRGLQRAQQEFTFGQPGATTADWLGYITGQDRGFGVGSKYRV